MSSEPVISDAEIDEAVAQIMDHAGVTDRGNGWAWRDLRDYADEVKSIITSMLRGEFKEAEEDERTTDHG